MSTYFQAAAFIAALTFWIRTAANIIVLMTDPQHARKR